MTKPAKSRSAFREIGQMLSRLGDERGVSAIEFALIFPILISLYLGVAELTQGLTIDRKVTQISSSVADLVSQEKTISANEISDVYLAAEQIIAPYDTGPLTIVVTSVVTDNNNQSTVEWSSSSPAGFERAAGSPMSLPQGLAEANTGVIVAEVTYDYMSNLGKFIHGSIELDDAFYLRPRNSATVQWQ